MAESDEIVQRFKVENGDAVEKLSKHDAALKKIELSTKQLGKSHSEHGSSLEKLGKQFVGLEGHHGSLRHAMRLVSEATGVNVQGMTTLSHSMGMLGPIAGAAAAGFIMVRQQAEAMNESIQKSKEKYEQLAEAVKKYDEERKARGKVFEFGEEGAKALGEEDASDAQMRAAQARLNELRSGKSKDYGSKSWLGRRFEDAGRFGMRIFGMTTHEGEENEADQLQGAINRQRARQEAARKEAEKNKEWNDIEKNDRSKLTEINAQQVYARGTNLKLMEEELGILDKQLDAKIAMQNAELDPVRKEALGKEVDKAQVEYARKKIELEDKRIERAERLRQITQGPGVFSTSQEKATFAENTRYEKEKREAERIGADTSHLKQNHEDALKKIEMDAQSELATQRASIRAQQLRNDGDNFAAEKTMADAHYQEMLIKDYGNKEKLKLDEEQHAAEIQKITIAHNNEVASYTSNLKQESLRIKGDQYGSEREALEEWQRKELELHKDQADQIRALHDQRAADITRREKEERTQILGGYATEVTGATLGHGAAGVQRMLLEHQAKQREYARTGQGDYAAAENQAFQARISRMKLESDMELSSKNRVGFMDVAGGWESFASSLNQNPMQQMQLNEQKATNQILREIQQGFRQTQPELVN